jgi:hypothetical protein
MLSRVPGLINLCRTITVDNFARTILPKVAATAPTTARSTRFELNLIAMNERTDQVGGAKSGITFNTKTTAKMRRKTETVWSKSLMPGSKRLT